MLLACSPKRDIGTKFHDNRSTDSEVYIGRACWCAHTVRWSQEPAFFVLSERKFGTGQGHVACCFAHGNIPLGSIKFGEYLDQLRNSQLLKKYYALWNWLVGCFLVSWLGNYLVSQVGRNARKWPKMQVCRVSKGKFEAVEYTRRTFGATLCIDSAFYLAHLSRGYTFKVTQPTHVAQTPWHPSVTL